MSKVEKRYPFSVFIDYGYLAREIVTTVKIAASCNKKTFSPYPKEFVAVWDTGAMSTTITKELAKKLGLCAISKVRVVGVTGNAICNTYLIALALPNGILIPELEVADCDGNIGCDILIGMDVISRGDFAICNKDGRTTFSFRTPSVEVIDFTPVDQAAVKV